MSIIVSSHEERRRRVKELLDEIGQEYPRCGFDVGDGWYPHVERALREMAKVDIPWRLAQVKQKFCQLRIYLDVLTPGVTPENHDSVKNPWVWEDAHPLKGRYTELRAIVNEAQAACDVACEDCGAPAPAGPGCGTKLCAECKEAMKVAYKKKWGEEWED